MPSALLDRIIDDLCEMAGDTTPVLSVVWGGEGEPTLHPAFSSAVVKAHRGGLRQGLITNGTGDLNELVLGFSWIRYSINGWSPDIYARVHGSTPQTRTKVLENIEAVVAEREEYHLQATVGVQVLAFEDNDPEGVISGAKALGVDYCVVKPYSHHPQSEHAAFETLSPGRARQLSSFCEKASTESFSAVFRTEAFETLRAPKQYDRCLAAPFFNVIDHLGRIYQCAQDVGDAERSIGSLHVQHFHEFVRGRKRRDHLERLSRSGACNSCRHPCRLDAANRYLERVKEPWPHDPFL